MLRECANCGKSDLVDNPHCIRVPELRETRHIIESIGKELRAVMSPTRAKALEAQARWSRLGGGDDFGVGVGAGIGGGGGGVGGGGGAHRAKCAESATHLMQMPEVVPSNSMLFTGPIHLQARASALIACAVHEKLSHLCGSNQCDAALGLQVAQQQPQEAAVALYNASRARERHGAFCDPLRESLASILKTEDERSSSRRWDELQAVLHPPHLGLHKNHDKNATTNGNGHG